MVKEIFTKGLVRAFSESRITFFFLKQHFKKTLFSGNTCENADFDFV